ncbi:hypothetical protein ACWD6R_02615 [Streptomyces sp. NPDC005151]
MVGHQRTGWSERRIAQPVLERECDAAGIAEDLPTAGPWPRTAERGRGEGDELASTEKELTHG